jgi:hypothetical protein
VQFGNFKKELLPEFGENLIIIPSQIEVKGDKKEAENF